MKNKITKKTILNLLSKRSIPITSLIKDKSGSTQLKSSEWLYPKTKGSSILQGKDSKPLSLQTGSHFRAEMERFIINIKLRNKKLSNIQLM